MLRRYRAQPGQVLVLFALVLVILLVVVGLAVDVSRAHSRQRELQLASNAAAMAGVNLLTQMERDASIGDPQILASIQSSFTANNSAVLDNAPESSGTTPNHTRYTAYYANKDGHHLAPVGAWPDTRDNLLKNAWYIMIESQEPVETYFAQLVGRDTLDASASGSAGICPIMTNVFPIVVMAAPDFPTTLNSSKSLTRNASSPASTGYDWLTWNMGGSAAHSDTTLASSLVLPGTLMSLGFQEGIPGAGSTNGQHEGTLETSDWVVRKNTTASTSPSNMSTIRSRINALSGRTVVLPIASNYSNGNFRISRLGFFTMSINSSNVLSLTFLGDTHGEACTVPPPPPCELDCANSPPPITGPVTERILYREEKGQTQDILIVFDASSSMDFAWTNHNSASAPNRRIDGAISATNKFIDEVFKPQGVDPPDDHVGLVTFGVTSGGKNNQAIVKHPFVDYTKKSAIKSAVSSIVKDDNTPTATGLKLAYDTLIARPDTRMVTVTNALGQQVLQSKKVKKIIFLVTDGMANTRLGLTTMNDDGKTVNGVGRGDDVTFQKTTVVTCPSCGVPRPTVIDPANSPIMQAVTQANLAKGSKIEVFVIGVAFFSNSMDYLEFDEMASNPLESHMFDARTASEMNAMVVAARQFMDTERCVGQPLPDRPAVGVPVRLYDSITGELLRSTTTGSDGRYTFNDVEPDRSYRIETEHRNVSGPDGYVRNYTWMNPAYGGSSVVISTDSNRSGTYEVEPILLTIERRGDPPTPVNVCQ